MAAPEETQRWWRDRPTLITGATGLLGSALVGHLARAGAELVCLVRDSVPKSLFFTQGLSERVISVRGDVRDQALIERTLGEYEIDSVFHLAAQTIVPVANRNPVATFETNVGGTWALLEACRRTPKVRQIVFASSDKAYGEHDQLPYDEETALRGRHPYDVSKSCADLVAQSYAATFGLPVVITRCGNFYGPGDLNWSRIVPGTMRSLLRGEPPVVRSDGKSIRDYFYVEDGARAYMLLAERLAKNPQLAGQAFNFSNEIQLTVLDLVALISRLVGSHLVPQVRNESRNEIPHQYLSAKKARDLLGWAPRYTLEEGLKETVAWYRQFLAEAT